MAETTTPRKSGGPSNAILIAAVVLGLTGMAVINSINQRLDPAEIERREKEAAEKQAEEAAKKAQSAPPPTAPGAPGGGDINALAAFGEEKLIGNPNGKPDILFVWAWTPDVQADPGKILRAVEALAKGIPPAKIRVINADAKPDMAPGVYVEGKQVMSPGPDGGFPPVPEVYRQAAMSGGMGGKSAPMPPPP